MNATTTTQAIAKHGVVTAAVLLASDLFLKPRHIVLTGDDLGYLLVVANAAAHGLSPAAAAISAKIMSWLRGATKPGAA